MGDRRQLVSAMHALLENAITYSYDNSKVVVTGAVQRSNPNLTHPAVVTASAARPGGAPTAQGDNEGEPVTGRATGRPGRGAAPVRRGRVERPTAPEEDGGLGRAGLHARDPRAVHARPRPGRPPATGTTAPAPPAAAPEGDTAGTGPGGDHLVGSPSWRIEERDNVRLSVQDHGVGIPARDLDRIFERFYRVDHGRSRVTGGTGLGLSIVRHVANNHQGWVDVESREGEGSTFTLVLPIQAERVV